MTEARGGGVSFTEALASFICGFRTPSPAVVTSVTRMVRDVNGCAIVGAADAWFRPLAAYAPAAYGGGGPVPAHTGRALEAAAALLLGAAAHLLDYDDVHTVMGATRRRSCCRSCTFSAISRGRRAVAFVTAFAVGVEVAVRVGAAINPRHHSAGWHPTGVEGALAAAACGASLLSLDTTATRRALGFAASLAGGVRANSGTPAKPLHAGAAGRAGVESTLLALSGATPNERVLDEQFGGFCELFAGAADRERATSGLGEDLLMLDPPVAFKLLPCCSSTQAAAWAATRLRERDRIARRDPADPGRHLRAAPAAHGSTESDDRPPGQVQHAALRGLRRDQGAVRAGGLHGWPSSARRSAH